MCGLALRCSSVAISCEFVSLALQCDTARRATRCIPEHRQVLELGEPSALRQLLY